MKITGMKTPLKGTVKVPGDKSISHRSVIFGALAEGTTKVEGFLAGEDCLSTIDCFRQMGVNIKRQGDKVVVNGVGLNGLQKPQASLYVGNSGTTIRILSGILAAQKFVTVIDGDASIRRRPMKRVIEPLKKMGALIFFQAGERAPLTFKPQKEGLNGGKHVLEVASAQVKSAILLAGLYTDTAVTVKEPFVSRDHTERMLKDFGVKLEVDDKGAITLPVNQRLIGCNVMVPGDISSAAFVLAAAAIIPGSCVTVENVGLNPTRTGIIDVLKAMGADITIKETTQGAEPVGNITVKYTPLKATNIIEGEIIPRLIDEIPIIAVVASTAHGKTVIKNAQELRVKESDRISLLVEGLKKFGIVIKETPDGMEIIGQDDLFNATDGLATAGDHRMAMAFAIAGLRSDGQTTFQNDECINVSFPGFSSLFTSLGADMVGGDLEC